MAMDQGQAPVVTRIDECLSVRDGHLFIEGCDAIGLVERFGSPMYVVSEDQLRRNARRFARAFGDRWPEGNVNVLPSHRLVFSVEERRYARGVRVDNVANRYELNLKANWRLLDAKTGKPVRTGSTSAAVTYDSADQPYASIAAQQDSQERAATEVARKIQLELAAWLAGKAAA